MPPADRFSICGCIFGGFGEMPWRPLPPKIQGCRIDQQIQIREIYPFIALIFTSEQRSPLLSGRGFP